MPHRVSRDEGGLVRSHAPGVVVAIPVSAGDEVQAGDVVAVTESMKMETSLTAPVHGRVREVLVGVQRARRRRPPAAADRAARGRARGGGRRARDVRGRPEAGHQPARAAQVARARLRRHRRRRARRADRRRGRAPAARAVRRRPRARPPATTADDDEDLLRSPQEYLHAFLRSLDAAAEGLPERFVAAPRARARPLRHRRARAHAGAGGGLLPAVPVPAARRHRSRRGTRASSRAGSSSTAPGGDELRAVLDRLESALGSREPALAELVRELRWRCCDEPLVEAARAGDVRGDGRATSRRWPTDPRRADRDERMAALVACPQPLAPLLGAAASARPARWSRR